MSEGGLCNPQEAHESANPVSSVMSTPRPRHIFAARLNDDRRVTTGLDWARARKKRGLSDSMF